MCTQPNLTKQVVLHLGTYLGTYLDTYLGTYLGTYLQGQQVYLKVSVRCLIVNPL